MTGRTTRANWTRRGRFVSPSGFAAAAEPWSIAVMASTQGSVARLWRYPVSSFAGEMLDSGIVGATGLDGDRRWGAVDLRDGDIARPGKKPHWDGTPGIAARLVADRLQFRVEDSAWIDGDGPSAAAALERHFGFPVALRPHPARGQGAGAGTVAPRYAVRHVHLLSQQSLESLKRLLPGSRIDERRFRPNLQVDLPGAPGDFPETDWPVGTELTVGQARLRVVEPCRRCVFVTVRHGDLPRDVEVLRAIAEHNKGDLGTICDVVTPGPVKPGDSVRVG